jgi:type II secretory pathway pseudopilin PulG
MATFLPNNQRSHSSGFTIIEVALVLAIAALIFLVAFLAVPALQRNQRDDARRRDLKIVQNAILTFNANNPYKLLDDAGGEMGIDDEGEDVRTVFNSEELVPYVGDSLSSNTTRVATVDRDTMSSFNWETERKYYTVLIITSSACPEEPINFRRMTFPRASRGHYAVSRFLETGGDTFVCEEV